MRGADMLFLMGFSGAVAALCQLLGFGKECWLATQMFHADWHGFNQHYTIFALVTMFVKGFWTRMAIVGFQAISQRFFVGVAELGNGHWGAMVYALG